VSSLRRLERAKTLKNSLGIDSLPIAILEISSINFKDDLPSTAYAKSEGSFPQMSFAERSDFKSGSKIILNNSLLKKSVNF